MDIKYRINKIHSDLINNFVEVNIEQKSNQKLGEYFEIVVSENYDIKLQIKLKNLESNIINWGYYANPLDSNSIIVERTSSLDTIVNDIKDIITNRRFSSDYVQKIEI
jgi:hypothetical protein